MFERHHLCAPVAVELRRQPIRSLRVFKQRLILRACQTHLRRAPVLQWVQRNVFEPLAHFVAQFRVERSVEREQQFELRVGAQPRRLIYVHAALVGDVIVNSATEKIGQVEARDGEHVARHIFEHALRHLALFWVERVAKINEQDRKLRMFETVECKWDQLDRVRTRRVCRDDAIVCVVIARLGIALPLAQVSVAPRVTDVEKAPFEFAPVIGVQV